MVSVQSAILQLPFLIHHTFGNVHHLTAVVLQLMGKHHDELVEKLGSAADAEFVHRDNLVLAPELKGLIK